MQKPIIVYEAGRKIGEKGDRKDGLISKYEFWVGLGITIPHHNKQWYLGFAKCTSTNTCDPEKYVKYQKRPSLKF